MRASYSIIPRFPLMRAAVAVLLLFAPLAVSVSAGYPVETRLLTLPRGDLADVHAPVVPDALRERLADTLPLIAVLQGALVERSQYERLGGLLAAQGFVVVIPDHLRTLPGYPEPALFPDVNIVTDVLEQMRIEDADPDSWLHRVVDTERLGLVGHSLGGAVGLYASAGLCAPLICDREQGFTRPEALRAAAFYGTNLADETGGVTDLDTSGVAIALLQGGRDGVAMPAEAELTYPTLEAPRALIGIAGANHYGICDENNPAGAMPDPSEPTLEQTQATDYVARWTALWLRTYLKDDRLARYWIYGIGGSLDGQVRVLAAD